MEVTKEIDLVHCPKCGNDTATYRHMFAKVWCPKCGYVLRKEGDKTIGHNSSNSNKRL